MERQGAKLADRPRSIVAGDTLSGGMRTLLMPSGPVLQKYRKYVFAAARSFNRYRPEPPSLEPSIHTSIIQPPRHISQCSWRML
jgi:hypothetical protein